jgi:hypothetical protein
MQDRYLGLGNCLSRARNDNLNKHTYKVTTVMDSIFRSLANFCRSTYIRVAAVLTLALRRGAAATLFMGLCVVRLRQSHGRVTDSKGGMS